SLASVSPSFEDTRRRHLDRVAQSGWRHLAIGLLDEACDQLPVGPAVDAYPDPAPRPDVGRPEETLGIQEDQRLLLAERRGQPYREMVSPVMVIVELGEQLALDPPRGLTPRHLLRGL